MTASRRERHGRRSGRSRAGRSLEGHMARFMDIHEGFFGVTAQQLAEAHQRDLDVEEQEGVHYEHAWLDPESGKVFCLATGPSKEAVMRVHERAGHPTPEVFEVPIEVARPDLRRQSARGATLSTAPPVSSASELPRNPSPASSGAG